MATLECEIPEGLSDTLQQRAHATGEDTSRFVTRILQRALAKSTHTLFQISTSRALVQGVYEEAVSAGQLLLHGDFGLGTFDALDGEMVLLDGVIYQVKSDGTVHRVQDDAGTPFATVLHFSDDDESVLTNLISFGDLCDLCDEHRRSQNVFYAFRVDGRFSRIRTRAMPRTQDGISLKTAAESQPEFSFNDVEGTLVGFWSPPYVSAVGIPGYHFHFLSKDRSKGGHVLDCAGNELLLKVEMIKEFHLALPDNEAFLRADLTADVSKALSAAEGNHSEKKA
ncbi:acetolactate decarboxylase [Granulicella sibirica]|uniref:Alpha-acetolactate decarboxylase n=1 Tax=Granulicella sibirica TaxID=2479048 RepID=A0A4Q0T481_9BACT|nr:acetolactate decarboxylase [Granulicella sibirica]RXH58117.1 Alpha-acetolactate decarboxylase [Granulicella sibirica]